MNCPYCDYHFRFLASIGGDIPETPTPAICERCGEVSLLEDRVLRKISSSEMDSIKLSPAWRDVLGPIQAQIQRRIKAAAAQLN